MHSFFKELTRRNVVRVGIAYVVVGWLMAQVAELLFDAFGAPDWALKTLLVFIAIGFPFALLFAWAFELTPEGLKRTAEVDASESVTHSTGRKLDRMIIGVLVIALGYFVWESRFAAAPDAESASAAASTAGTATPTAIAASVAVLPFVNLSSDPEQTWFADGLTEEILNSLVRIPDLLVAARTSSFAYKGTEQTVPEIARELGVSHVLEGSVRRGGERIRVTAQLIRADDGFHLWSETYDRDMADVISIQEDVAFEIAQALKTAMDPDALAQMVAAGTRSVEAYEAYLNGLARFRETSTSGDRYLMLEAQETLERATEIDPDFSDAYVWLAQFWAIQLTRSDLNYGLVDLTHAEMTRKFNAAIDNAIRTESNPVDRAGKQAFKAFQNLAFRDAMRYSSEFFAARPNDFIARGQQIGLLTVFGRYAEAAELARETASMEVDTLGFSNDATFTMLWGGTPEQVREAANEAIRRYPNETQTLYQAHRGLLWAGDVDGASRLVPILAASDLEEENRLLVTLRQACAERRLEDAARIAERLLADFDVGWIVHKILGDETAATESLRPLDNPADLAALAGYLGYGSFDPRPYPNLVALLEREGIERGEPIAVPYRCNR